MYILLERILPKNQKKKISPIPTARANMPLLPELCVHDFKNLLIEFYLKNQTSFTKTQTDN